MDTAIGRDPISHPVDENDSELGPTTQDKSWGNLRAGNHLTARRQALDNWRYDRWKRDYWFCTFGEVGVMPDVILSTLASSVKIETIDELVEVVPGWAYARKYGDEVLSALKDASSKHKLELQAQRTTSRQANQKRKREDLRRDEEQLPLTSANTRIITPIIVKHVGDPTIPEVSHLQPLPPRPQPRSSHPRPQPSRPQSQPILISRPYARTDVLDILMDNSGCVQ